MDRITEAEFVSYGHQARYTFILRLSERLFKALGDNLWALKTSKVPAISATVALREFKVWIE